MQSKTRVVVVDDSALVRSLLKEIIDRQADMQCVGVAADPIIAALGTLIVDPTPLVELATFRQAASRLVDAVGFDN
mgnify:CR=1 FL=1